MTEKGKGTALPLAVGTIPIHVDFHPPQPGRPANKKMLNFSSHLKGHSQQSLLKYSASFPPDNTSANKPHQSKSLISSGLKTRVSHIMLFPCLFLWSCSYLQDKEKESNQSALGIKLPVRNRLLGTLA
ncbi:hypothetical protein TB2_014823 [Malus domestica]